jgi:hypothetical protein
MQDQKSIHYRVGGKLTHAGVEMLPGGKDIERIIIARIEYKESEMINGRTENGVWVAHFAQNPYTTLPLILNATNRKRLVKLFPDCDGYIARLENVPVRLTKEKTRDVQDGGETWGLRISKIPALPEAAVPQKKVITADKVDVIIEWAKNQGFGIDNVAKMYDFADDTIKKKINDALIDDLPE